MMRREGWERALLEALESAAARPFAWGEHDCSLFAADIVLAMTGVDAAAQLRGGYRSAAGAARVLKRFAGGGLMEAVERITRELGMPEIPPPLAQRGDVVLLENAGRTILGVIDTHGLIAALGEDGALQLPLACARRAWRL